MIFESSDSESHTKKIDERNTKQNSRMASRTKGKATMEVGGDGVAVITLINPPVNSLSFDGTTLLLFSLGHKRQYIVLMGLKMLNPRLTKTRAKGAFQLCERLMIDAIDDLKSVLTQTCMDTFEEIKSSLMRDMVNIFKTSRELSSNSLAMATDLPTILPNSNITGLTGGLAKYARKLLYTEDGIPTWVGPHARRLMAEAPKGGGGGPPVVKANVAVAQDGSGHFKTITDALNVVPRNNRMPFIIHIKEGVYKERVKVTKKMAYVTFIGDGPTKTKITGSLNFGIGKVKTFLTSTLTIEGEHFTAKNIGIENTAGPKGGQAVALRVSADYAVFYSCQIGGYQDTLSLGTVDFIFGDAKCILQNCKIVVRKPKRRQSCMVTAQGRSDVRESTGLVLHNCHIVGEPAYIRMKSVSKAYLGRPWKEFSRTIIMKTTIEDVIDPAGWLPWRGDFALKTLYYAEHLNVGPGSNQARRVKWPGIKRLSPEEALLYTGGRFLVGDSWIPQTQVPYTANM
ncbi:hypothetical protein Bca52824_068031 [Brassica carinata]|uniref:Pectinesterase n=2 Tax=Brassica carinata TaxID=52824 RepID=A0A8X7QNP7_BRACI|nr:hypothetical protein Bca52824_068031 [Brassica carinata]